MATKKSKEIRIFVKEVQGKRNSNGDPQYTVIDKFDNKYGTLQQALGKAAKKLEGESAIINYTQNGRWKNLQSIKPAPQKSREDKDKINREGQSFGNARNCASIVIASFARAGFYGDLSDQKVAKKVDLEDVADDIAFLTGAIEDRREDVDNKDSIQDTDKEEDADLFDQDEGEDDLF